MDPEENPDGGKTMFWTIQSDVPERAGHAHPDTQGTGPGENGADGQGGDGGAPGGD